MKEDLNEIQNVSKDISVDKIKTLKHVNRSHSSLLEEIKKAKSVDTGHHEDTMNLFD